MTLLGGLVSFLVETIEIVEKHRDVIYLKHLCDKLLVQLYITAGQPTANSRSIFLLKRLAPLWGGVHLKFIA